jgi:flagellar assembly protein FliH
MDAAVDRLRMLSDRLAADMRNDALEVAMMLARKIVEGELTTNVDKMMGTVRSAVRRLGESRRITVRLCPEDAELLTKENKQPGDVAGLSAARVEVVADPALGRGDCLVEGDLGSVDGRQDTRFAELRRVIAEDAAEGAVV